MPDKNGDFILQELQHPTTPLAALYHRKLPKYGWAGSKNATEKAYIRWFKETHRTPSKPSVHDKTRALRDKPMVSNKGMKI